MGAVTEDILTTYVESDGVALGRLVNKGEVDAAPSWSRRR